MHHLCPCSISLKHLVYVTTEVRITGLVWPEEVQSFKTGASARSSPLFCVLVMPVPERNGKDGRKAKLHTNTFSMTYMLSGTTKVLQGVRNQTPSKKIILKLLFPNHHRGVSAQGIWPKHENQKYSEKNCSLVYRVLPLAYQSSVLSSNYGKMFSA